jgi:hypothetical protein
MPTHDPIMRFFAYEHLSDGDMRAVSKLFAELASVLNAELHPSDEKRVALRKLLEAKDCAVRARMEDIDNFHWSRPARERRTDNTDNLFAIPDPNAI